MALSGGHPPVAGQVLAALALAVVARRSQGRRRILYALAAGAVVGIGTWYTRSVVVAGPCVVVALWPSPGSGGLVDELLRGFRSKALWAGFAGMALFPALLVMTYALHNIAETRSSTDENFARRLLNPIVDMESCTHYEIQNGLCEEGEGRLERLGNKTAEILLLDVPLLYEIGLDQACTAVAVVSAPADIQRQRVLARGAMTEAEFQTILARQLPDAEKRKRATYIIPTTSLEAAAQAVKDVLADIRRARHA